MTRRPLKSNDEVVKFDAASRVNFLTGFHKRKLERTKLRQEKKKEWEKKQKKQIQQQNKMERLQRLQEQAKQLEMEDPTVAVIASGASENDVAQSVLERVEKIQQVVKGQASIDELVELEAKQRSAAGEEWNGLDRESDDGESRGEESGEGETGKGDSRVQVKKFQGPNTTTTVTTVEAFDVEDLMNPEQYTKKKTMGEEGTRSGQADTNDTKKPMSQGKLYKAQQKKAKDLLSSKHKTKKESWSRDKKSSDKRRDKKRRK